MYQIHLYFRKKRDFWRRIEAHKFESNSFKKSLKQIQTSHLPWDLFDFAMNFRDFPSESQKNHDRPGWCGSGSRGFLYLHSPVLRRLVRSADGAGVGGSRGWSPYSGWWFGTCLVHPQYYHKWVGFQPSPNARFIIILSHIKMVGGLEPWNFIPCIGTVMIPSDELHHFSKEWVETTKQIFLFHIFGQFCPHFRRFFQYFPFFFPAHVFQFVELFPHICKKTICFKFSYTSICLLDRWSFNFKAEHLFSLF